MFNLLEQLALLITDLNDLHVPYTLCGGLALAVHGIPRATVDIDILVPPDHLPQAMEVANSNGFQLETPIAGLAGGTINLTRLTKFSPDSEDYLSLDILHAEGILSEVWTERQQVESKFGEIWVLPPNALIRMKKLRGSTQDKADIERLTELLISEG